MVTNAVQCVSYLLAGPIADRVFEPLMRPGGPLADGVGALIGVGPGRGMALLVLLLGLVVVVVSVAGYLVPGLRRLPDRPPPEPRPAAAEPDPAGAAR
jgi:hypothetical protein